MIASPDNRYLVRLDLLDTESGAEEPHTVLYGNFWISSENVENDVVSLAAQLMSSIDHYTDEHLNEDGEFDPATVGGMH